MLFDVIGALNAHLREVDGFAENARRGSCFEASDMQMKLVFQGRGEFEGGRIAGASAGHVLESVVHFSVEEGPCGENHSFGAELFAELADDARDIAVFEDERAGGSLTDAEIGLELDFALHRLLVTDFVALCAGGPDSGTFSEVQQTELQRGRVGDASHGAAEGVDFADDVSFCDSADRGIAAHLRDMVKIDGEHQRGSAGSGGSECGLARGMSAAHHDYVKIFRTQSKASQIK